MKSKLYTLRVVICLAYGLVLFQTQAALNVAATTADLGSIASAIGGDGVKVKVLAKPGEDPHFVSPRPSMIVTVNRADVLIEGGADLESGWLPSLVSRARNRKIQPGLPGRIAAAETVRLLEKPASLDRSQGDIHAKGNPHFMIDPENAIQVARLIMERFCEIDSKSCERYRRNYETFESRLNDKLVEWKRRLAPFEGADLSAYHNTWPYFAGRFGLRVDHFLEPKPGIPPSPGHLAKVIDSMKARRIKVILIEPYQGRRTAEKVASDTGAEVVEAAQQPGGFKGFGPDYIGMMDALVSGLERALAK